MKIQLVSDLHLEFGDINIKNENNCDVLILSGDIMVAADLYNHPQITPDFLSSVHLEDLGRRQQSALRFREFLKRCSFQFPHVIYVAGNHEFYHFRWNQTLSVLRDECANFPNVYFLENGTKTIDDVLFVGATLWTDMNKGDPLTLHAITNTMNDYSMIRDDERGFTKLRPANTALRHRKSRDYICTVVDNARADQKVVVCTHHAPTRASIHSRYVDQPIVNAAYASDLSELILDRPRIKLWTHGHTHDPHDYMVGSTRVVCNPRGYDGFEETGWNPNIVIEV